jgi:hypothetical protein
MIMGTASNNTPPGGGTIHIGTAVVTHGGPHPNGNLPFTGADVGLYAIVGVAMIASGWRLRRKVSRAD